jgi:hypothetical protein
MLNPYEPPQMNSVSASKVESDSSSMANRISETNGISNELIQLLMDIRDTNRQTVAAQMQIAEALNRIDERTSNQMQMVMGRFRWIPFLLIPFIVLIPMIPVIVQIFFRVPMPIGPR